MKTRDLFNFRCWGFFMLKKPSNALLCGLAVARQQRKPVHFLAPSTITNTLLLKHYG
jgi:hypothetical protein